MRSIGPQITHPPSLRKAELRRIKIDADGGKKVQILYLQSETPFHFWKNAAKSATALELLDRRPGIHD
jgi:hypothetical protein